MKTKVHPMNEHSMEIELQVEYTSQHINNRSDHNQSEVSSPEFLVAQQDTEK